MRNVTTSKFVAFIVLVLALTTIAAREASADSISQSNAAALCNKYAYGLVPAGAGTSCLWCSKQGRTQHCYAINCGGGVSGCEFTQLYRGTNPPPNHRPVVGFVPVHGGVIVAPPKGRNPVPAGGLKAPNSGVMKTGGGNQPITIERNNTEPSGGGGGGAKK
jgi:hypothetical protein